MLKLLSNTHIYLGLLLFISLSCSKNNSLNQVDIQPVETQKKLSLIILLGDGLGVSQMTAAWNEQKFLNLQKYPYSGLVLTQSANKFVTESGAANTAMMTGVKTNYGYLGLDAFQNPQETLYEYLREKDYFTGIISTSFMADATLAALFSHRTDRHAYEDIALDYYHRYPDFAVAGGRKHFDNREDHINLLDSLSSKGVQVVYQLNEINSAEKLPILGLMHESLPPYLIDGREDFLYQSSVKALELFDDHPFFLFVEGGHIDKAGHDMNIEKQISETLEFDKVAGMTLDYAKNKENVLVVVLSDHECGGLSLMPGADNGYIPNYAADNHSGSMVAVFAYGPGAENFTGIMDNTDIYEHLKTLIDLQINN